jgi:hypothetical protein
LLIQEIIELKMLLLKVENKIAETKSYSLFEKIPADEQKKLLRTEVEKEMNTAESLIGRIDEKTKSGLYTEQEQIDKKDGSGLYTDQFKFYRPRLVEKFNRFFDQIDPDI